MLNPAHHSSDSSWSPQDTPAQGGMVFESPVVTYAAMHVAPLHMPLCKLIYELACKATLAPAIASMLPNSKFSCICPMGKVLLEEEER